MATHTEIRYAIAATIQTVSDVGEVHTRERFAKRMGDFRKIFASEGDLRVWIIVRRGVEESSAARGRRTVIQRWQIRHYAQFNDNEQSEIAFDTRVDAVRDAFRNHENLGGSVITTIVGNQAGVQVTDAGPVMFADVLCHSARLALSTLQFDREQ